MKLKTLTLLLIGASLMTSRAELFPTDSDGTVYSIIISLSKVTHGWLYDYANYDPDYPGAELIGFPIWPDKHPKIFKFWEPGDDKALDAEPDAERIICTAALASVDLEAFSSLISSLEAALDLSKASASFVFAESTNLIEPGVKAGTLIVIPAGTAITVHKVIPNCRPGASMALITYQGRNLIMPIFKDSFASLH
jgi:hypothetical protein